MAMAPFAALFWLELCTTSSLSTEVSMTRNNAMYSIARNCRVMPLIRARLRPIQSIRKIAQMREETNLTTPKMAVAKSFSFWPVVPIISKYSGA